MALLANSHPAGCAAKVFPGWFGRVFKVIGDAVFKQKSAVLAVQA